MKGNTNCLLYWATTSWNSGEILSLFILVLAISAAFLWRPANSTECTKQKYFVNIFGVPLNATVQCPMYFQWTVSDLCCYGKYDRFDQDPYCCYSDTYKLVLAVGLICLIVLGTSCIVFFCWAYNLPHHLLYILTCGHFHLNNWMKRNTINGPYVDPSFYSGEPFWSRGASEIQPYPLRPMPPRIFYPAAPANIKFRWDGMTTSGQMPLFIVASRQFTRNPYSARPSERSLPGLQQTGSTAASRSSSITTLADAQQNNKYFPLLEFHVNMDEMEAAAELLEALKRIEEKGDKCLQIPSEIPEETTGGNEEEAGQDSESLTTEELISCSPSSSSSSATRPATRRSSAKPPDEAAVESELKDKEDSSTRIRNSVCPSARMETANRRAVAKRPSMIAEIHCSESRVLGRTIRSSSLIPPAQMLPFASPYRRSSSAAVSPLTPPSTGSSFKDDPPAKEVKRVDVPYTTSRLPGSIPEN